jgi:hypothetical protein
MGTASLARSFTRDSLVLGVTSLIKQCELCSMVQISLLGAAAATQDAPVVSGTQEENVDQICRESLDPKRRAGQALGAGNYTTAMVI